jgi:hypothetical protein
MYLACFDGSGGPLVGRGTSSDASALRDNAAGEVPMKVQTKVFRSSFSSWKALFEEATSFATEIGRDQLISISHSADHGEGVVVVWYWGEE